jgi:Reverse transcriptase (RNA-dependent DNA polymerase).
MNFEERNAILKLIKEYSDIFYIEGSNLTFTNEIKHRIKTSDEIPVYTKSYRYPEIHKNEVRTQIQSLLDQKIIRPSCSPWSSPIWVVPKKIDASGKRKWRIVVDYRKLNEKTIGDRYPLPNITDLLDKLGRCQYFSTLDLASGFHQIEMAEEDIPKTAFNTEQGHFEYLRMPFGLRNSPATFQRVMDNILRGIQNERCLVYLDDIIIFSTSLQEHIDRLREVFDRLRAANFKVQLDKSEFLRTEVAYLGHIVTPDGIKPNPDKIRAIQNFPIPSNSKQLKGFLGLLGYYRKFIKDFAKVTKPLTKCLKKDATINTKDPDYISCFELCKNLLINEPILQYPNFAEPFILTTDASNYALGAVLSQGKIGTDLPVAYASRTLSESEVNYSTIEKELLAIVWATKYFRPYLFGRKFKIVTDHRPLQWLFSLKEPNSKLVRWRLKLEEFEYEIIYKKGSLNKNADALSRIELNLNEAGPSKPPIFEYIDEFNETLNPNRQNNESVVAEAGDLDNQEISENDDATVHSNHENPIIGVPIVDCPVNFGKNQIIISQVNFAPADPSVIKLYKTKQRTIVQFSENKFEQDVIKFVKERVVPKVKYYLYFEDPIYEQFCTVLQNYFKNSEIRMIKCTKKLIDVTSDDEINQIIQNHHEGKTNHRGIEETEKE